MAPARTEFRRGSGELLAEGQVLDHQVAAGAHSREERRQEGCEDAEHRAGENPGPGKNRQWFQGGRGLGEQQALITLDVTRNIRHNSLQ